MFSRASGPEITQRGMVIVRGPLAIMSEWVGPMNRMIRRSLPMWMALALGAVPILAQQNGKKAESKEAPATEVTGTVQTFSGNILDIKPFTTAPAVWVTIPAEMKVDRDALKPGVKVSVEARWATVTYLALKSPKIIESKKPAEH